MTHKNPEDEIVAQMVGDLLYLPDADLPFGKEITLGIRPTTIFHRAIEDGYRAGIRAHTQRFEAGGELESLTDAEFTALIDQQLELHPYQGDVQTWRAYFIVGWTCVALVLVELDHTKS